MKTKSLLTSLLILLGLTATTGLSYALARLLPDPVLPARPDLPPLTGLTLPPQTDNGYTATLESYYGDASRLIFQIRVTGGPGHLGNVEIFDSNGDILNSSMSWGSAYGDDPSLNQAEFNPLIPISGDRFRGKLVFSFVASPGDMGTLAEFVFDLDLPIHPALAFDLKQSITANGVEILLDRVVITPAYTQVYLCYLPPTKKDWMTSRDTTLSIDSESAGVSNYALLFDSTFGDGTKGGEPGWTPPIAVGRCVKLGFPAGLEDPQSLTLSIPALEQSMPEVIPPEEAAYALEKLKTQGIEMTYKSFSHGSTWEFQKLPAGMTEQEALQKFMEALGYFHFGPWVFDIQLNGK